MAQLENGKYGLAFASGMAAIDTVLRLVKAGEHVLAGNDVYGGTFRLLDKVFKDYGVEHSFVEMTNLDDVKKICDPTRGLWF